MSATDDQFEKTVNAHGSCAPLTGSETRWQVLDGRFHPSEESKRGWNMAWQGESRYEAERVIEVRAETPEAARTLALEIALLLNGGVSQNSDYATGQSRIAIHEPEE
jgi:hypothetical protein